MYLALDRYSKSSQTKNGSSLQVLISVHIGELYKRELDAERGTYIYKHDPGIEFSRLGSVCLTKGESTKKDKIKK